MGHSLRCRRHRRILASALAAALATLAAALAAALAAGREWRRPTLRADRAGHAASRLLLAMSVCSAAQRPSSGGSASRPQWYTFSLSSFARRPTAAGSAPNLPPLIGSQGLTFSSLSQLGSPPPLQPTAPARRCAARR